MSFSSTTDLQRPLSPDANTFDCNSPNAVLPDTWWMRLIDVVELTTLIALSRTCTYLRHLCYREAVWKRRFETQFPELLAEAERQRKRHRHCENSDSDAGGINQDGGQSRSTDHNVTHPLMGHLEDDLHQHMTTHLAGDERFWQSIYRETWLGYRSYQMHVFNKFLNPMFALSAYVASVRYDHFTQTYSATYINRAGHTTYGEDSIAPNRLRTIPDCLEEFEKQRNGYSMWMSGSGADNNEQSSSSSSSSQENKHNNRQHESALISLDDFIEIQWSADPNWQPFGWWLGRVVATTDDTLTLVFDQYDPSSSWYRCTVPRELHSPKPFQNAFGYIGGVRRLEANEVRQWQPFRPATKLFSP
jgi:hypothetical protein